MSHPDPPPVRPYLCDRVHAALLKAGRPVTRSELASMFLPSTTKVADVQDALDALLAEGLAARGEAPGRWRVRTFVLWRATGEGRS